MNTHDDDLAYAEKGASRIYLAQLFKEGTGPNKFTIEAPRAPELKQLAMTVKAF